MEINWLEDFLVLAACNNFSRAAELRNMTQPAFSRRIRGLEEWLGVALFDRGRQPVTLTEAGEHFRQVADETVRRLYQGRDECREVSSAAAATLRFAATHSLSLTFFPNWLRSVEAGKPLGAIRLISDSLQACESIMLQGQAQFLLCHHHPAVPPRLDPAQFRSVVVGTDVLVPLTAPRGDGAGLALPGTAAAPIPYLGYSEASGMGRIVAAAHAGQPQPLWLETVFTSHLAAVLRAMATSGRGVAWLPVSLVRDDLDRAALVRAGDERWDIPVEIRLFQPRSRQSPAAQSFWTRVA